MLEQAKLFVATAKYCVNAGAVYERCQEYVWTAGVVAVIAIVLIALLAFLFRYWRLASKKRGLDKLAIRLSVADELTLQQYKWKGDAVVVNDKHHSDLTTEIRNALRSRKLNS